MAEIRIDNVSRRSFIKMMGLATGGLMLQGSYVFAGDDKNPQQISLNAFIRITPDNKVTLIVHQAEMGQGAQTTLPAILADELGANWDAVIIENGLTDPAFKNPKFNLQFTGNAESIRTFHDILRNTAASAREMLKQVAAKRWQVDSDSLRAENSYILNQNGKKAPFGDFVEEAMKLDPPKEVTLKKPSEWKLTGNKSLPRVDVPAKVNGTAVFGIDVEIPKMLHAAIAMCPYFGGSIREIKENGVRQMSGFVALVRMPVINPIFSNPPEHNKREGVAIVADTYWNARKCLDTLEISYDKGPNAGMDSESLHKIYEDTINGSTKWFESVKEGDAEAKIKDSKNTIKAQYYSAWQSHAPMEPMNATAHFKGDTIEVWAPTQGQEMAQILLAKEFGIPVEKIIVNRTYLGGGFGRRLLADYIYQAVFLSKEVGLPVKVLWTREDDMQHDFYRPGTMQEFQASLNDEGLPEAIYTKLVSPSILQVVANADYVFEGEGPSYPEGIKETPYHFENRLLHSYLLRIPPPSSVWRSTGFGTNVFALESFIDELASKKGEDPITFRKRYIADERSRGVLDAVAEASEWYTERKYGHFLGIALTHSFETFAAQVIEISIDDAGILDIHKITTAVDCGTVLDPGIASASIESGIVWGLTAALTSEINFKEGRTVESNFHDFKILGLPEFDIDIETVFVNSGAKIGGVAESGPIPVAPALCNAIFAASGKRYRTLPLKKHNIYTRYASDYVVRNN